MFALAGCGALASWPVGGVLVIRLSSLATRRGVDGRAARINSVTAQLPPPPLLPTRAPGAGHPALFAGCGFLDRRLVKTASAMRKKSEIKTHLVHCSASGDPALVVPAHASSFSKLALGPRLLSIKETHGHVADIREGFGLAKQLCVYFNALLPVSCSCMFFIFHFFFFHQLLLLRLLVELPDGMCDGLFSQML